MNSITLSSLTKSVFENRFMSSLLALAVWTAGAVSGSLALMVVAGVVAYGRPLLYSALLNNEKKAEKSDGNAASRKRFTQPGRKKKGR